MAESFKHARNVKKLLFQHNTIMIQVVQDSQGAAVEVPALAEDENGKFCIPGCLRKSEFICTEAGVKHKGQSNKVSSSVAGTQNIVIF